MTGPDRADAAGRRTLAPAARADRPDPRSRWDRLERRCGTPTDAAVRRFEPLLAELVAGTAGLARSPAGRAGHRSTGRWRGGWRPRCAGTPIDAFVTPMAAVAGAVADESPRRHDRCGAALDRAYANNGGDIALCTSPTGQRFDLARLRHGSARRGRARAYCADRCRRRRSAASRPAAAAAAASVMGVADSVTVLARTAAVGRCGGNPDRQPRSTCQAIRRSSGGRRDDVDPESDLGDRLVAVACGRLEPADVEEALGRGVAVAGAMRAAGLVEAAALFLQGRSRTLGHIGQAREHDVETVDA